MERTGKHERYEHRYHQSTHKPNMVRFSSGRKTWRRLPHLDGTTWHGFRRGWVTLRKRYSIVDIAAAGGWNDTRTVENSYMQADSATKQRVVLLL